MQNTQDFQKKAQEDREQKEKQARESALKMTQEFIQGVLTQHRETLKAAEFHYQVTFCETKYTHRYINFEIEAEQATAFDPILA